MYPVALIRILIQTIDSSQVFERRKLQKQPKIVKPTTKNWDNNTIKDLKRVGRKQAHDFLS